MTLRAPGLAGAAATLLVLLAAAVVHADTELVADDRAFDLPTRVERHLAAAAAATAAHDLERAAHERNAVCVYAIYGADPRAEALCGAASAAAAPYPRATAQLAAYLSCAAAWALDWPRARQLAEQALALLAEVPPGETMRDDARRTAHLCIGAVAIEEGKYDEAERELSTFVAMSEEAGDRSFVSIGLTWQCRLDSSTGQWRQARERCARGIELASDPSDPFRRAGALWQAGNLEIELAGPGPAAALWEAGLRDAVSTGAAFTTSALQVDLADAYVQLGRLDEAARLLDAHDRARTSARLPDSYARQVAASRGALLAARGDHVAAIAAFDLAATSAMQGPTLFALTHRARSQVALGQLDAARASLREAVARIEGARGRTSSDDQRRAYIDRHAEVFRALAALELAAGGADAPARALAAAEAGRARTLLDAIAAAGGRAPLNAAAPVTDIQRALAPEQVLVVYVSLVERLFALRVDAGGVRAVELPGAGDRGALADRVAYYRDLVADVEDPGALAAAGAALYADVLAPVVGDAPGGTLVLAPDGPLHALPFDALRAGDRFLAERAELMTTPSGSLLATRPHAVTPSAPVLTVGAPELPPGLTPLPAARSELRAVADALAAAPVTLTGRGATEAALRDAGPARFDVLHFATHAVVDDALPLASGLALTASGDDDGWLRAGEIYRMTLAADLVVLSACRTGDGASSSSEGPLSLARAFLHAGAAAVVATRWEMPDRYGPPLMASLYRHLAAGQPVSRALVMAQRELIRRGAPPRAWAGFVAIGHPDAAPSLRPAGPPRPWWRLAAAGLGLAGLAAMVVGLRRRARMG